MHAVQVVEDSRGFRIALREQWCDPRRHRHDIRQRAGRIDQHLLESRHRRGDQRGSLVRRAAGQQRVVEPDLQPVISPDQPIELRIPLPEGERVRLALHEIHALGLDAERQVGPAPIVRHEAGDFAIPLGLIQPVVGEDVIDLAMQHVRPLEHHLGFRNEPAVCGRDRGLLERQFRRIHQQPARNVVVLPDLEHARRRTGARPEHLVQDRVTVVERVEEAVGHGVLLAEDPVVRRRQVVLLADGRPLGASAGHRPCDQQAGAEHTRECVVCHHRSVGKSLRRPNARAAPNVSDHSRSSSSVRPTPASNAQ